ncbi:MAG: GFA family protein [Pseudorhodoplanes sp.]
MNGAPYSGGCQCGAVRFRIGRFGRATICHCRMCQKAFGSFYGPLVTAHDLVWTRGAPKHFASSNKVRRGFCEACGTPLTYEYGGPVEIAIGALDDPRIAVPVLQLNPTDKLAFVDALASLPTRRPQDQPEAEAFKAAVTSNQHPDHDTVDWPQTR